MGGEPHMLAEQGGGHSFERFHIQPQKEHPPFSSKRVCVRALPAHLHVHHWSQPLSQMHSIVCHEA